MPDRTLGEMARAPVKSLQAKPGSYRTLLSLIDELEFLPWVRQQGIQDDVTSPDADYDWRGFYKAWKAGDPRAVRSYDPIDRRIHAPDIWKTPYHESFSNESMYAQPTAPHWEDGKLVNPLGITVYDESKRRK